MTHRLLRGGAIVIALIPIATAGCEATDKSDADSAVPHARRTYNMHDVMQAKLVHTQSIIEALATADFDRIEYNATALVELSESGDWMVHETIAYASFSDDFRNTARTLAINARSKDIHQSADDYAVMLDTCIACHDYLRRERLIKDMPGKVSMHDDHRPLLLAAND